MIQLSMFFQNGLKPLTRNLFDCSENESCVFIQTFWGSIHTYIYIHIYNPMKPTDGFHAQQVGRTFNDGKSACFQDFVPDQRIKLWCFQAERAIGKEKDQRNQGLVSRQESFFMGPKLGRDQTMQQMWLVILSKRFPCMYIFIYLYIYIYNSALCGLVSYEDPCKDLYRCYPKNYYCLISIIRSLLQLSDDSACDHGALWQLFHIFNLDVFFFFGCQHDMWPSLKLKS